MPGVAEAAESVAVADKLLNLWEFMKFRPPQKKAHHRCWGLSCDRSAHHRLPVSHMEGKKA